MSFYLITRLDAILTAFMVIAAISGAFFVSAFIVYWVTGEVEKKKKYLWHIGATAALFAIASVLTPNTQQACAIYAVNYMVNNKDARELPDKMLKSANLYFDRLIEDLEKDQDELKGGEE